MNVLVSCIILLEVYLVLNFVHTVTQNLPLDFNKAIEPVIGVIREKLRLIFIINFKLPSLFLVSEILLDEYDE